MLDRLRTLFQEPPEEKSLPITRAVDHFEDAAAEQITAAEEQEDVLRADIQEALSDVENALQALEEYDHDNTRVADVTTNVAADRLRRINTFDVPDDPQQLFTALDTLIDDMRAVSRKEQAVLDHVDGPVKQVFRQVDDLEDHAEELEQFLDAEYSVVQARQELETLVDRWHRLREERDELEQELADIDIDAVRNDLRNVAQQLDDLADDPEQQEKEALEQDISDLEDRRDSLQQTVGSAASAMERGLKKLLYATRNGDVSLSHEHVQVLEAIRDGRVAQEFTPPAADVEAAVDAALDAIDQIDLGDRQQQKFQDGADQLRDLEDIRSEMERIEEQIDEKQEALDALSIDDRRAELKQERKRLQRTLQDRRDKQQQLEERIDEKEQAIADVRHEIEELLNDHLRNKIRVEPVDGRSDQAQ